MLVIISCIANLKKNSVLDENPFRTYCERSADAEGWPERDWVYGKRDVKSKSETE